MTRSKTLASTRSKLLRSTPLAGGTLAAMCLMAAPASAQPAVDALPTGQAVADQSGGDAITFAVNGGTDTLTVDLGDNEQSIINWTTFDVGADADVHHRRHGGVLRDPGARVNMPLRDEPVGRRDDARVREVDPQLLQTGFRLRDLRLGEIELCDRRLRELAADLRLRSPEEIPQEWRDTAERFGLRPGMTHLDAHLGGVNNIGKLRLRRGGASGGRRASDMPPSSALNEIRGAGRAPRISFLRRPASGALRPSGARSGKRRAHDGASFHPCRAGSRPSGDCR